MTARHAVPPGWRLERRGLEDAELWLTGDWVARETGLRDATTARQVLATAGGAVRLRFRTDGLGRWDSALIAFLQALRRAAAETPAAGAEPRTELDETGLPEAARRLLALAAESGPAPPAVVSPAATRSSPGRAAGPPRAGPRPSPSPPWSARRCCAARPRSAGASGPVPSTCWS